MLNNTNAWGGWTPPPKTGTFSEAGGHTTVKTSGKVESVTSTVDRNTAFVGSGVTYGLKYARHLLDDGSDGDEVDDSANSSWSEAGDSFAQVGNDIAGAFDQLGDELKDAFSGRRLLDADSGDGVGFEEVEFDIAGGFNGAFDEFAELQNAIAGGRKLLDGESPIVGDLKQVEGGIQTAFNELGDELSDAVSGGRSLLHKKNILKAIVHQLSPSHDQVIASQARMHQKQMDDSKRLSEEATHRMQEQLHDSMRRSEELAKPCMHSISPSFGGTQPPFPSHNDC